ncbi:MAG: hypothetical protein ACO3P4_05970 [Polynucleobacter sp.]|jgi:hypothetical protein
MENPNEAISNAPVPSKQELKRRKNILIQMFRFAILNLKMLKIIGKGHKH